MGGADLLEKTLMLGKTEGRRGREKTSWLDGISDSMDMNLEKLWKVVTESEAWSAAVRGATKSQTQLGDGPMSL